VNIRWLLACLPSRGSALAADRVSPQWHSKHRLPRRPGVTVPMTSAALHHSAGCAESAPNSACVRTSPPGAARPGRTSVSPLFLCGPELNWGSTERRGRRAFTSQRRRSQVVAGLLRVWSCSTGFSGANCNGRHADFVNRIRDLESMFQLRTRRSGVRISPGAPINQGAFRSHR
jgi:hypothetical protein